MRNDVVVPIDNKITVMVEFSHNECEMRHEGSKRMRSMAERVRWINDVAEEDLDRAQGMLDMFNEMYGTSCGFLARRVVYSSAPIDNVAEFYANCHDLLAVLTIG